MINELLNVLSYVALVFGGAVVMSLIGVSALLGLDSLWEKMKERSISQYKLIKEYGFSSGQLDRLRKNDNISTYTLNRLCEILDCNLEDIAEYRKEK